MKQIHKPCLARAAVTSSARVASWGDSSRLMLPEDETLLSLRGEATLDLPGDCVMISAPWSTRALACSLKFSFWLSICPRKAMPLNICFWVKTRVLPCQMISVLVFSRDSFLIHTLSHLFILRPFSSSQCPLWCLRSVALMRAQHLLVWWCTVSFL